MNQVYTSIILAGGKGTRMGVENKHKSTFEIAGVPSILWLIDNLRSGGIRSNIIVVGAYSNQIMDVVSKKYPDVAYAYQPMQKGTGNAAKYGARFLKQNGYDGNVLIVAGDAYIEPDIIKHLIDVHEKNDNDLSFLVKNKNDSYYSGRVVLDGDTPVACVEYWDIMKSMSSKKFSSIFNKYSGILRSEGESLQDNEGDALKSCLKEVESYLFKVFKDKKKIQKIFPAFNQEIQETKDKMEEDEKIPNVTGLIKNLERMIDSIPGHFILNGKSYDAEVLEETTENVNISVYLFKSKPFFKHVEQILSDNAQNEEYLTDIIQIFSAQNLKIGIVPVFRPENVMAFNNPEEYIKINEYVSRLSKEIKNKGARIAGLKNIEEWIKLFEQKDRQILNRMKELYGDDYKDFDSKFKHYLATLKGFKSKFPESDTAFIARAPGRLNLMGRHVDHRGGDVNMLAIDSEIIAVASPRKDDSIVAYNFDPVNFPAKVFSISDILSTVKWKDWFGFISNNKINQMVRNSQGDWINYLKASALRLQVSVPDLRLKGANIFISGKIPQAAGLSSSSALVVATLECLSNINSLNIKPREFIDLCGEGEWFVGTRGGSSDHAAIKISDKGKVTRIGFFDFQIKDFVEFPEGYDMLIINSMKKAKKSSSELKKFNEKIFAYEVGFNVIKERYPQYENKLHYLRDLSPENLNITLNTLYQMFKTLPIELEVDQIGEYLRQEAITEIREKFSLIQDGDIIPIRSVLLYGVSECARSKICLEYLKKGAMKEFGEFMNISHDGDRVVQFNDFSDESKPVEFNLTYNDEQIEQFCMKKLQIEQISGAYRCSIPEIDYIVDVLKENENVLGAQISGAGLGGCVMALIKSEHSSGIIEILKQKYRNRWDLDLEVLKSQPILGASLF